MMECAARPQQSAPSEIFQEDRDYRFCGEGFVLSSVRLKADSATIARRNMKMLRRGGGLDKGGIQLTVQDYFLLGSLIEDRSHPGSVPRGCTDAQAERLVKAGYLDRHITGAGSGWGILYSPTSKGRAVWQAYKFRK